MKRFVDFVFIVLFGALLLACIVMVCAGYWWNILPAVGLVALVLSLAAERREERRA